jgi:PTS system mannose-specific IIB component/fructoselysine and glucoselysine-specific PTS system IIB component
MTLTLCRVDDRLIHGQVVIGWGIPLGVEHIVLVDETVAANEWEQDIYRMAVPADVTVEFSSPADSAPHLRAWASDPRRIFLLTGDIATMVALVTAGDGVIQRVNLGGIHAGTGRRERLRYVYLTADEASTLQRLEAGGTRITAQDLPTSVAVPLSALTA